MQLFLIDSHAHVQFAAYDEDREAVVARALGAGIGMVNIGTQYATSADTVRLAASYPDGVWATVGFHPNHVGAAGQHDPMELREPAREVFDYERFRELARRPQVVAVGECGLDCFRSGAGSKDRQREVFVRQIELAYEMKKPLVVHCRQAFPDLVALLDSKFHILNSPAGVVHFFSGSWEDARKLLDLGFYLGFGGVITFARDYDEAVQKAPLDRLLVETDAPYVAPVPYRGRRNEPAYITETVRKIAELRGISYDEVAMATLANAHHLFGL